MSLQKTVLILTSILVLFLASCGSISPPQTEETWVSLDEKGIDPETYEIMGVHDLPENQFFSWLRSKNSEISNEYIKEFYRAYKIACRAEGVKLILALAQALHETGFLKFGGTVKAEQNNFAGIGAVNAQNPGNSFASIAIGALAHVQHLKAYASTAALVLSNEDPRFRFVKRGIAPHLIDLSGRWAQDPLYHTKIKSHIERMLSYRGFEK